MTKEEIIELSNNVREMNRDLDVNYKFMLDMSIDRLNAEVLRLNNTIDELSEKIAYERNVLCIAKRELLKLKDERYDYDIRTLS